MMGIDQVKGDLFQLKTTNPKHFGGPGSAEKEGGADFSSLLFDSLREVNKQQQDYADLSVKALTDPDSVNPHDITIAGAQANLSLNITKNVIDRVIRAYKEITSLR